jgi:hypothetical protein
MSAQMSMTVTFGPGSLEAIRLTVWRESEHLARVEISGQVEHNGELRNVDTRYSGDPTRSHGLELLIGSALDSTRRLAVRLSTAYLVDMDGEPVGGDQPAGS